MGITLTQIQNAKEVQDLAAQDMNATVRVVAGPGTGKSFVIVGRVLHLLQLHINPTSIFAHSHMLCTIPRGQSSGYRALAHLLAAQCPAKPKQVKEPIFFHAHNE